MSLGSSETLLRQRLEEAVQDEFQVLRKLGQGGMGSVYLARDLQIGRLVAIKVSSLALMGAEGMADRFMLEVRSMGALQHPNIVGIHTVRRREGLLFFVMDYVDGVSIAKLLKRGPVPLPVVQWIAYQVGSALAYAARKVPGLVHRDIKPGNILCSRDGVARVTDFGIAKVPSARSDLTRTDMMIGTPEFMSPEHCEGKPLTAASDQYSLGVVLFKMLTGQQLFSGNSMQILISQVRDAPPSLEDLRPSWFPDPVVASVDRMLSKQPEDRWPSIADAVVSLGGRPLTDVDPIRASLAELVTKCAVRPEDSPEAGIEVPVALPIGDLPRLGGTPTILFSSIPSKVRVGQSLDVHAWLEDGRGTRVLGQRIRWSVDQPEIASIDSRGGLTALRPGRLEVIARTGDYSRSVALEVLSSVAAIELSEPDFSLKVHEGARLTATCKDEIGQPINAEIHWSSDQPNVALVDQGGDVLATGVGEASIRAEAQGVAAEVRVAVAPPVVATISIDGPNSVLRAEQGTFTASCEDERGNPLERSVLWRTSDDGCLSIDDRGRFTAEAPGQVRISASIDDVEASVEVDVLPRPAASITFSDVPALLMVGESYELEATVHDDLGYALDDVVEFTVTPVNHASVDADNVLHPHAAGALEIQATCGSASQLVSTMVQARPAPVVPAETPSPAELWGDSEPQIETAVVGPVQSEAAGPGIEVHAPPESALCEVPRTIPEDPSPKTERAQSAAVAGAAVRDADTRRSPWVWAGVVAVPVLIGVFVLSSMGGGATTSEDAPPTTEANAVLALQITPLDLQLVVGDSVQMTASMSRGTEVVNNPPLLWSTTDSAVAIVRASGRVIARAPGLATISVGSDSLAAATQVAVTLPQAPPRADSTPLPREPAPRVAVEDGDDPPAPAEEEEAGVIEGPAVGPIEVETPTRQITPLPDTSLVALPAVPGGTGRQPTVVDVPEGPTAAAFEAAVRRDIAAFVAALKGRDTNQINAMLGPNASSDVSQSLLDRVRDARDFDANRVGTIAWPTNATEMRPLPPVRFEVEVTWRSNFGPVSRSLPFEATFVLEGTNVRLAGISLAPGAEP